MFFNSFDKKMKKIYKNLNIKIRDIVFPNGQDEFIYVTTALNNYFKKEDIMDLISIYSSVYTYSKLQKGNYYGIYKYAKKKMYNFVDEKIYLMMAFILLNQSFNKNLENSINIEIEKYKNAIINEINSFIIIEQNPEIFSTKNDDKVGTEHNPILLPGISGVEKYFSNIVTLDGCDIQYKRVGCTYYTEPKIGVSYAIDQYCISNKETKEKICDVYINEYGTSICNYCPQKLMFRVK